jgi:hypothetical protein
MTDFVGSSHFRSSAHNPTVGFVETERESYVVECFWPDVDADDLAALERRIDRVVAELATERAVRYLGSILLREAASTSTATAVTFEGNARLTRPEQQLLSGSVNRSNRKTHPHGKAQVMSSYTESEPLPNERESECERVNCWRFEQFSALGFEPSESLLLAASEADLQEARALIAAGCTLRLALRILL